MEVLETKFIFRVTVGFLHASPAVPRSGSGINQAVASGEESVLTPHLWSSVFMRTAVGESVKIRESERHKGNTKRIETHDDNTDDDDIYIYMY